MYICMYFPPNGISCKFSPFFVRFGALNFQHTCTISATCVSFLPPAFIFCLFLGFFRTYFFWYSIFSPKFWLSSFKHLTNFSMKIMFFRNVYRIFFQKTSIIQKGECLKNTDQMKIPLYKYFSKFNAIFTKNFSHNSHQRVVCGAAGKLFIVDDG